MDATARPLAFAISKSSIVLIHVSNPVWRRKDNRNLAPDCGEHWRKASCLWQRLLLLQDVKEFRVKYCQWDEEQYSEILHRVGIGKKFEHAMTLIVRDQCRLERLLMPVDKGRPHGLSQDEAAEIVSFDCPCLDGRIRVAYCKCNFGSDCKLCAVLTYYQ